MGKAEEGGQSTFKLLLIYSGILILIWLSVTYLLLARGVVGG